MPTSNQDLDARRERIADLRREIEQQEALRNQNEVEARNDIEADKLDQEIRDLESKLEETNRDIEQNKADIARADERRAAAEAEAEENDVTDQGLTAPGAGPGFQERYEARHAGDELDDDQATSNTEAGAAFDQDADDDDTEGR